MVERQSKRLIDFCCYFFAYKNIQSNKKQRLSIKNIKKDSIFNSSFKSQTLRISSNCYLISKCLHVCCRLRLNCNISFFKSSTNILSPVLKYYFEINQKLCAYECINSENNVLECLLQNLSTINAYNVHIFFIFNAYKSNLQ